MQMHAAACEALLEQLKPGAKVLDVGCGSGYLLGIFHELVSPRGKVVVRSSLASLLVSLQLRLKETVMYRWHRRALNIFKNWQTSPEPIWPKMGRCTPSQNAKS